MNFEILSEGRSPPLDDDVTHSLSPVGLNYIFYQGQLVPIAIIPLPSNETSKGLLPIKIDLGSQSFILRRLYSQS